MESYANRQFWKAYRQLPSWVRERARDAYRLFESDPRHPSLHFKRVHSKLPLYSARVTLDYRAVGVRNGEATIWFWIGPHDEYKRLLSSLT